MGDTNLSKNPPRLDLHTDKIKTGWTRPTWFDCIRFAHWPCVGGVVLWADKVCRVYRWRSGVGVVGWTDSHAKKYSGCFFSPSFFRITKKTHIVDILPVFSACAKWTHTHILSLFLSSRGGGGGELHTKSIPCKNNFRAFSVQVHFGTVSVDQFCIMQNHPRVDFLGESLWRRHVTVGVRQRWIGGQTDRRESSKHVVEF